MRLLYTPAACSISPHIILEEIGATFESQRIEIMQGETQSTVFLGVNPKGKIPVLILDDGTVVTENPVILQLLARLFPECVLLPVNYIQEFEVLQLCEYLTGTMQTLGIGRLFRPASFRPEIEHADAVRKEGAAILRKGFDLIAPCLMTGGFLFDQFSIADASLFYFELHASRLGIAMPDAVQDHFEMMLERPAVIRVFAKEDLDTADFRGARSLSDPHAS
jgi:glutathione S-transferase